MGFLGFLPFRLCCARRCRLIGLVVVLVLRTMFVPSEVVVVGVKFYHNDKVIV